MTRFLLFCLLLLPLEAGAMQIKEGVSDGIITARISNLDLNRLKVISDSILSIKFNEGELEVLEDSGEVYLKTSSTEKLSAFVSTDKGYTYQLLLMPESIPSEQIFIKNDEAILSTVADVMEGVDSYKEGVISLMGAMREGVEHNGYTRVKKNEFINRAGNRYKLLLVYEGDDYIGEVLEYKGRADSLLKDSVAVSYEPMGDITKVYVIREADNEAV